MPETSQEAATMKVEEAAKYLGISRQMAYDLVRQGELPGARKLGGRIIVSREVLERWLLEEIHSPRSEA